MGCEYDRCRLAFNLVEVILVILLEIDPHPGFLIEGSLALTAVRLYLLAVPTIQHTAQAILMHIQDLDGSRRVVLKHLALGLEGDHTGLEGEVSEVVGMG